jgi:hypothetical protein
MTRERLEPSSFRRLVSVTIAVSVMGFAVVQPILAATVILSRPASPQAPKAFCRQQYEQRNGLGDFDPRACRGQPASSQGNA